MLRGVFANDGTTVLSSRIHTRSRAGEEDCVSGEAREITRIERIARWFPAWLPDRDRPRVPVSP